MMFIMFLNIKNNPFLFSFLCYHSYFCSGDEGGATEDTGATRQNRNPSARPRNRASSTAQPSQGNPLGNAFRGLFRHRRNRNGPPPSGAGASSSGARSQSRDSAQQRQLRQSTPAPRQGRSSAVHNRSYAPYADATPGVATDRQSTDGSRRSRENDIRITSEGVLWVPIENSSMNQNQDPNSYGTAQSQNAPNSHGISQSKHVSNSYGTAHSQQGLTSYGISQSRQDPYSCSNVQSPNYPFSTETTDSASKMQRFSQTNNTSSVSGTHTFYVDAKTNDLDANSNMQNDGTRPKKSNLARSPELENIPAIFGTNTPNQLNNISSTVHNIMQNESNE